MPAKLQASLCYFGTNKVVLGGAKLRVGPKDHSGLDHAMWKIVKYLYATDFTSFFFFFFFFKKKLLEWWKFYKKKIPKNWPILCFYLSVRKWLQKFCKDIIPA
jgi:hypothetical protein